MSAQDDVLAAFGELPRKPQIEEIEEIEEIEAAEAAEVDVAKNQSIGGPIETGEESEATEPDASTREQQAAAGEESEAVATDAATDGSPALETHGESSVCAQEPASADSSPAPETGREPDTGEQDPAGAAPENGGAQEPASPVASPTPEPLTGEQDPAGAPTEPIPSIQPPAAAPGQPYLDPAAFFAQLQAEAAPKPKRRWPRLVLRYASALVVVGAIGAGTAYAITLPRRTDVPFLATPSDGRYTFPPLLAKPAPPSGKPAPGDDDDKAQIHYGDLRQYLLPAPSGAVVKEDGWEPVADFESSLSGTEVSDHLYDAGLRHVARRGWSTPDGQHTVVELLQFPDHQAAYDVENDLAGATPAKADHAELVVPQVTIRGFGDETYNLAVHRFDQVTGLPGHLERRVVFQTGDVVAVVTTTAPAKVPDTPTEQVVMLQAEMLR